MTCNALPARYVMLYWHDALCFTCMMCKALLVCYVMLCITCDALFVRYVMLYLHDV